MNYEGWHASHHCNNWLLSCQDGMNDSIESSYDMLFKEGEMDLIQFGNSDAINIILMVAVKKAETTAIEPLSILSTKVQT